MGSRKKLTFGLVPPLNDFAYRDQDEALENQRLWDEERTSYFDQFGGFRGYEDIQPIPLKLNWGLIMLVRLGQN